MAFAVLRRLLVAAALVAAPAGAAVSTSSAAGPSPVATTGALRICSDCAQTGGDLARYGYVILNSWDAPMIPAIKAANPGVKVLEYKNLSFSVDFACSAGTDNAALPAGVGYCDASTNHPDWFLGDTDGNRIASASFTSSWLMDVGNPAYQQRWLENVTADVRSQGWDGVFADDTDADMAWHLDGRTIAKYPTTADWQAATRSMLARVGPALTSQGILFIPNLYAPWLPDYDAQALWKDWLQFTSGAAQEYYSKWGTGSSGWFQGSDWTFRQQFQTITENAGKIFLGLTYAPHSDERSMTYARANFLLDTSGGRSALIFEPGDQEASDPYSPSWTADVGTPAGARYQVGAAWRRQYSGGTVLVNPSDSPATVQLGGRYLDAGGATVTSVTLAPATGAVLRSTDTTPAPPAPPGPVPGPALVLAATHTAQGVTLDWHGRASKSVSVFRNSVRIRTTANDGSYLDRLGTHASGTFTYRVCLAGTTTCSDPESVVISRPVTKYRSLAVAGRAGTHHAAHRRLELHVRG